jgi:ketosteroid isomerase-like protein
MIDLYFEAFEQKDLNALREMFSDDVVLQDPVVGKVRGLDAVINIYQTMFIANDFQIKLLRQCQQGDGSFAVEFSLVVTDHTGKNTVVDGVDLIELRNGKIASLRAYLDTSVQSR